MSFSHVLGNRESELIREAPLHPPRLPGAAVRSLAALLCRERPLLAKCHQGQAGHGPGSPTSLSVAVFPGLPYPGLLSSPRLQDYGVPSSSGGGNGQGESGHEVENGKDPIFQIPTPFLHPENLFHNRHHP